MTPGIPDYTLYDQCAVCDKWLPPEAFPHNCPDPFNSYVEPDDQVLSAPIDVHRLHEFIGVREGEGKERCARCGALVDFATVVPT